MNITIAELHHLDGINNIRAEITKDQSSNHQLSSIEKYEIENTHTRITFITIINDLLVGYLTLHHFDMFDKADDAIFEMFVLPEYQGKGIGSALIKYSEKYIQEKMPFKRLVLGVLHCNEGAIKLYKRNEFEEIKSDIIGMYMAKNL